MKKIAIYTRVSTHHQIDKDSLPLQRQDLINYSKFALGVTDYEIFEDAGFSGKNMDRPAFQKMIAKIRNGEFTHLLVWKIDRISRNLMDFCDMYEELKKYNCTFISKNEQFDTSSAMGEAMLKIILVFAELERKLTGERVTSIMLDRATKGLWNGAPVPLGYKWDKVIKFPVIDDIECRTIELIYNTYIKAESTSVVRNDLNTLGIKTKRNGTWTTKTISDIIRNPFYKGTYRYNYRETGRGKIKDEKEWIILDDNHQGIISKELWNRCNTIMDTNAQRNNARFRGNSKTHVFASLLECGECNGALYSKEDKPNKDGYIPSIYICSSRYNKTGCTQKTISDKLIGTFILTFIKNISELSKNISFEDLEQKLLVGKVFNDIVGLDPSSLKNFYNHIDHDSKDVLITKVKEKKDIDPNMDLLKKEKIKYQRAIEKLEDLYLFDEDLSKKDYILKKNKLNEKLNEINKKLKLNIYSDNENSIFIEQANNLILTLELKDKKDINYKVLVQRVSKEKLKEFISTIIKKIVIINKCVKSIEFRNGLVATFIYE
ncbi:MAG: recombinase family protein [Romboutsia sp.]